MAAQPPDYIKTGIRVVLDRRQRAAESFAQSVAEAADISLTDGWKVFGVYQKAKVLKYDGMRFVVKHGAFWDRDVLLRALAAA